MSRTAVEISLQKLVDLFFADEIAGDFLVKLEAGDFFELLRDGVDFPEDGAGVVITGRLSHCRGCAQQKNQQPAH